MKRIDAALLLVRSLKLDTTNVQDVNFLDVPKTYRFYKEIAAITNAGIIQVNKTEPFRPECTIDKSGNGRHPAKRL